MTTSSRPGIDSDKPEAKHEHGREIQSRRFTEAHAGAVAKTDTDTDAQPNRQAEGRRQARKERGKDKGKAVQHKGNKREGVLVSYADAVRM